jgi:hypothetical protein
VHDLVAVDELQFCERHDAVLERGLEGELEASERLDRVHRRKLTPGAADAEILKSLQERVHIETTLSY